MTNETKEEIDKPELVPFLLELVVYSVLITLYLFLALHYLSGWLKTLSDQERWGYATAGMALMIVQAVVLEQVTVWLLRLFRGKKS